MKKAMESTSQCWGGWEVVGLEQQPREKGTQFSGAEVCSRQGCCQQQGWAPPCPNLILKDSLFKNQQRFPLLSLGTVNIPFFPAAVQTDKAVARAPNLRELGEPFLKHTIVATMTWLQLYCWLIITRKKEEKREEKNKTKEKAFLNVGVQRKT